MAWPRTSVAIGMLLLAVAVGCSSDPGGDAGTGPAGEALGPSIDAEGATITRTFVGPSATVDDIEAVEGSVVVLASTARDRADLVLHSGDGGSTWEQSSPGLPVPEAGTDAGVGGGGSTWMLGPEEPLLFGAGSVVYASRPWSPSKVDPTSRRLDQALRASFDGGATWTDVDLPVPADHTAIVSVAGLFDDTVVLAGTVQRNRTDGAPVGVPSEDLDAYDAGIWTSGDGGRSFEQVEGAPFAGQPGMQVVRALVPSGDRLVALGWDSSLATQQCCFPNWGTTSWATQDARRWSALDGLQPEVRDGVEVGNYDLATVRAVGGGLELGGPLTSAVLAAGSDRWTTVDRLPVEGVEPRVRSGVSTAQLVEVGDGSWAATWVEDAACDCEVAVAGRVELTDPPAATAIPLIFDDCSDTSVRGETGIAAPRLLGDAVGALAWCNDRDRLAASWAGSTDGGATWEVTRLAELAPAGSADVLVPERPFVEAYDVAVDGGVVLALQGRIGDDDEAPAPGPIVLLRVDPVRR